MTNLRDVTAEYVASDLAWLQRQLDRFTYKPGWTFRIDTTPTEGRGGWGRTPFLLTVTVRVEDTYHPGQMIDIGGSVLLPYRLGEVRGPIAEREFARFLIGRITDIELHESREWLKRDGEIYDDPHK